MTIYGWDMSHYDGPGLGDAVSEGIRFVTHKAGGDRDDPELGSWWNAARHIGNEVVLGAYWVLYPGDPTGRADRFLARLDAACPGWRDRDAFLLQPDCEKWGGDQGTVPSKTEIEAFCHRLVERTDGDYRPIVYGPKWVYGNNLIGLGYPLWASSYVNGAGGFKSLYPGDDSHRWGAYSGQIPAILQYSSSATIGGQSTCDANAYRGTLDELKALVAPGKADDMTKADFLAWLKDPQIKDAMRAATNPDVVQRYDANGQPVPAGDDNPTVTRDSALALILRDTGMLKAGTAAWPKAVAGALATLASKDDTDEPAIVAGVLAGLDAETIAAAIPAELATQVADQLAARLQA